MNKLIYGVAASILLLSACGESENEEIYNENNTNVINGVVYDIEENPINGIYNTYYANGSIKMEMNAEKGLPNGEGRFYDENGNLQYNGTFSAGKINGKFYQYFEDGTVHNELNYNNGIQDGPQILYDNNGQVIAEVTFENNKAVSGYVMIDGTKIPLEGDDLTDLSVVQDLPEGLSADEENEENAENSEDNETSEE